VRTASGSYSSPAYDSGTDYSDLTSIILHEPPLIYGALYHWRVRYLDSHGLWSNYSAETNFAAITGYTPTGTDVTVTMYQTGVSDQLIVSFHQVTAPGCTWNIATMAGIGGEIPPGIVNIWSGGFLFIITEATYTGPVTIGISYDAGIANPQDLKLFQWQVDHWQDVTDHVDTGNHIIYGVVDSVSAAGTDFNTCFFVGRPAVQATTNTGNGTVGFGVDTVTIYDLTGISLDQITTTRDKPTNVDFPYGLFSFNIGPLAPGGVSVVITITFPNPVPVGTRWWKVGPTADDPIPHWYSIPIGSDDGDNVITITLTDGGQGDDNYISPDGVITDPGGPAFPQLPSVGAVPIFPSLYIGIVAALAAGVLAYFVRRRLLAHS
jgi:hypothetical protein